MTRIGVRIGTLVLIGAALLVMFLGFGGNNSVSPGTSSRPDTPELSLAQVASAPSGVAAGDLPASDVGASGAAAPDVNPDAILGSPNDDVVGNGCHKDYGTNGQCLPAVAPTHEGHDYGTAAPSWTCSEVRGSFTGGVALKVAGVDPLGLDANGNGTACDPADGG
jgi:hypothetical protein